MWPCCASVRGFHLSFCTALHLNGDLASLGALAVFQAADSEALWEDSGALSSMWEQLGLRGSWRCWWGLQVSVRRPGYLFLKFLEGNLQGAVGCKVVPALLAGGPEDKLRNSSASDSSSVKWSQEALPPPRKGFWEDEMK